MNLAPAFQPPRTFMKIPPAILSTGLVLFVYAALAQSFAINRFTTSGGGGTSTGGVFAVSGTAGQPEASAQPMTNGGFSLTGGFWTFLAVQTPGAPMLSVERQGAGVRVFWPLPATDFVLDQSPAVTGAWSPVAFPYTTNANSISISVPAPTGHQFYRLRKW